MAPLHRRLNLLPRHNRPHLSARHNHDALLAYVHFLRLIGSHPLPQSNTWMQIAPARMKGNYHTTYTNYKEAPIATQHAQQPQARAYRHHEKYQRQQYPLHHALLLHDYIISNLAALLQSAPARIWGFIPQACRRLHLFFFRHIPAGMFLNIAAHFKTLRHRLTLYRQKPCYPAVQLHHENRPTQLSLPDLLPCHVHATLQRRSLIHDTSLCQGHKNINPVLLVAPLPGNHPVDESCRHQHNHGSSDNHLLPGHPYQIVKNKHRCKKTPGTEFYQNPHEDTHSAPRFRRCKFVNHAPIIAQQNPHASSLFTPPLTRCLTTQISQYAQNQHINIYKPLI